MASATSPRTHHSALDGLRGLAILAVVAFHVTVMATRGAPWAGERPPPAMLWPLFAGKLGVDIFFVLSGFLVMRSWVQISSKDKPLASSLADYSFRRAKRIFPAFWFSLVLLIPLRAPEWLGSSASSEGLRKIFMFVTAQQFLDPQLPHEVNVVTWSLTTELHFYVLLPALAFLLFRFGWPRLLGVLVAGTICWRLTHGGTGEEAEWIFGRIDQFAAGMAASVLVAEHDRTAANGLVRALRSPAGGWVLAITGLAVAAPLGTFQLIPKPLAYMSTFHAVFGLVAAGLLVRLTGSAPRALSAAPLRGLGHVSYSLYLWHWPLLIEASARWGPTTGVLGAALVVTAVMTLLSYFAFERPFTKSRVRTTSDASAPVPFASGHR